MSNLSLLNLNESKILDFLLRFELPRLHALYFNLSYKF